MSTRQVILYVTYAALLAGLSSCSPSKSISLTQTAVPSTATAVITATATVIQTPSPVPATSTPTPLACLSEPGIIKQDVVATTNPPQQFIIYLPPCYENSADTRFPVLYLLNGQTYDQDQWVRLGAPAMADKFIHSKEAEPFIMVYPDDRYWNSAAGPGFGDRFINDLIPYVDKNYRTLTDREHRTLGGLSRGGGWSVKLGFEHPELFGAIGLHSPAVSQQYAPLVEKAIQAIPAENRPKLWFDIGDSDMELTNALALEEVLTRNDYIHKFYRFAGDHTEKYWSNHLEEYMRWYTQVWQEKSTDQ